MIRRSFIFIFALIISLTMLAGCKYLNLAKKKNKDHDWTKSVVEIKTSRILYDYSQPWSSSSRTNLKQGIVLDNLTILTTAAELWNSQHVQVRKNGRGNFVDGEIVWIDYYANLALIKVQNPDFWVGLSPVKFAQVIPPKAPISLLRWKDGDLEGWDSKVQRVVTGIAGLSLCQYLEIQISSNLTKGTNHEIAVYKNQVLGLVASGSNQQYNAIPSSFIQSFIDAKKKNNFQGLGYFPFYWQPTLNPNITLSLGYKEPEQGVIITRLFNDPQIQNILQPNDLLLEVDGFKIDSKGDFKDPQYGYLNLEYLASRNKWAGQPIKFKVFREGKLKDVIMKLPPYRYDAELVQRGEFDRPPEYYIAGGLIFQPLNLNFLKAYGSQWETSAPFRLLYFNFQDPTEDYPHRIVLTQVLPDEYNLGYQGYEGLVIDKINHQKVSTIDDVERAFKNPQGDYHIIDFMESKQPKRIVISADNMNGATQRVLQRYSIPQDRIVNYNANK
jgi:hypothetical protein